MDLSFYKGKKVLITGNTGFKGTWMTILLQMLGADVIGYSLEPPTDPNLFKLCNMGEKVKTYFGDVRDKALLENVFKEENPEIVFHLAAQPLVRESYENPCYTYEVNVMGTVNVLDCVRNTPSVKSMVNITTDKVYLNKEWDWGYRENEELNGYDPYSNSKSCSELVTSCFTKSFFNQLGIAVSTARAGNVIGGGDYSKDRIIPDCVRAAEQEKPIEIRNPYSIRPYQFVLEPIVAYLMIAMKQYDEFLYAGNYNVGPEENDCISTGKIADLFCNYWNDISGNNIIWINKNDNGPHEAKFLKLDSTRIRETIGWKPTWNIDVAIKKSVEFYYWVDKKDPFELVCDQIKLFGINM